MKKILFVLLFVSSLPSLGYEALPARIEEIDKPEYPIGKGRYFRAVAGNGRGIEFEANETTAVFAALSKIYELGAKVDGSYADGNKTLMTRLIVENKRWTEKPYLVMQISRGKVYLLCYRQGVQEFADVKRLFEAMQGWSVAKYDAEQAERKRKTDSLLR